jgi:hypothetical protein
MGVLPVPEIVKDMAHRIEELTVLMKAVSAKIDVIQKEVTEMKAREQRISDLSLKVEILGGRVSTLTDRLAWLCTSMENGLAVKVARNGQTQ